MFFLVIMAFALVLSEGLPPPAFNLLAKSPTAGPLLAVAIQLVLVGLTAYLCRERVIRRMNAPTFDQDGAADALTQAHQVLLLVIGGTLMVTMVCTPWAPLIRHARGLRGIPLAPDLIILGPFFASMLLTWTILFPAEMRIRVQALAGEELSEQESGRPGDQLSGTSPSHLLNSSPGLSSYLLDKFRHQLLVIAAPMTIIVFAKFYTDRYKPALVHVTRIPWIGDSLLGTISFIVLLLSPLILRYVWSTQPLPAGPLRDRFVRTCRRIGLRYREILLWRTHGLAVNAAVMGFVPPLRYILVSDALLHTMNDDEIEAVFGHEAGHIRHWHLQFFGLFALVSMYISGGVLFLLWNVRAVTDQSLLNLIALAVLLACWLFGFGWLSRKFERQADLFGVRCITPDIKECASWCPIHGKDQSPDREGGVHAGLAGNPELRQPLPNGRGSVHLCTSAAQLFGRTLMKIADLNGIPRHAPSWRHGSIDSRCSLIERMTTDPAALGRFDRLLWRIKAGLVVASLIGTAVAAWLYYPTIEFAFS